MVTNYSCVPEKKNQRNSAVRGVAKDGDGKKPLEILHDRPFI